MDTFGAISVPVATPTAPVTTTPVADPALYYLGQFSAAVLNADANPAWRAVDPMHRVVQVLRFHEPDEMSFNERDLPALFMWRDKSEKAPEWIAEDILQTHELIQCVWVMPHAVQEHLRVRHPSPNTIMKTLTRAIELGVHESWTVQGDAEVDPVTLGSVLTRWSGVDAVWMGPWLRKVLNVPVGDGGERRLYGTIEWTLRVDEALYEDITKYPALAGINQTITTPDGLVTEYAEFR